MGNDFGWIRVPLCIFAASTLTLVSVLLTRVISQFYCSDTGLELSPLVGYSAVSALAGYVVTCGVCLSAVVFYGVTDGVKIPLGVTVLMLVVALIVIIAKYTLFTVRLKGSFQDSVYRLLPPELYSLYIGLCFTLMSGLISYGLWRRNQSYEHPRKIASAIFALLCALSHISVSIYFVWLFVGRLRTLLHKSTSLETKSSSGHVVQASVVVHSMIRAISKSEMTRNDPINQVDFAQAPTLQNHTLVPSFSGDSLGPPATIAEAKAIRAKKERTVSAEEVAVKKVIEDSEIADKTMIVVMVRYTLLRIISAMSSLITVCVGSILMLVSVPKTVADVHETEIFVTFVLLESMINSLVLCFSFYSFGFSVFRYELCCGRAESLLMHCFEERLKNDFYEHLLREAQMILNDEDNLRRARSMHFDGDSRKSSSMTVSKTGLSSALI